MFVLYMCGSITAVWSQTIDATTTTISARIQTVCKSEQLMCMRAKEGRFIYIYICRYETNVE